jgi:CheY-like chemotaxis protein/DNA-directed RNA polymerase specialized sigma24 family protein
MSTPKELLVPHIPYLRRYARALTGSQTRGDKYLAATLEAIINEVALDELNAAPKVVLFRMFHDVWQRLAPPAAAGAGVDEDEQVRSVKRALAGLPRWDRQAYLLNRLEKFSVADIATILRANAAEIETRIQRAADALGYVPVGRVLIIEDDPVIALGNAQIVRDMGHEVAGIAATKAEALTLNASQSPDILLVDIRLGGDDGLDTVQEIIKSSSVPVVFVTGHPEDLLTGRKREPAFVVTKPFDPEVLKVAISNALSFRNSGRPEPTDAAA